VAGFVEVAGLMAVGSLLTLAGILAGSRLRRGVPARGVTVVRKSGCGVDGA
jgi:hypothetical protein